MNKIYLVGMGPGDHESMTFAADAAIERADVLCGYSVYLDLLKARYPGKDTYSTPMTQELARCRWAIDRALEGKTVAVICSGDAGIYGMASPLLRLARDTDADIEIVPGITAAVSGAAVLGAPLAHDFCVISLSDLLTPWETIEKRLRGAGMGDFSIALYNPRSKKRAEHLRRACDILLEYKAPETVCGWVRNIGRDGRASAITTLGELGGAPLDMFCTAFIGTSGTENINGRMVTPRGYEAKR